MESKPEGEKCGCGPGCSCKSAGCGCYGGRAGKALIFLLLGGIIGYLIGGHCAHKKYCAMPGNAMMMTQPPQGAPTTPPQK